MSTTSSPASSQPTIRAQINRKLLESGEYERHPPIPHQPINPLQSLDELPRSTLLFPCATNPRLARSAKRKFDETGWTEEIQSIANRNLVLSGGEADLGHIRGMSELKFSKLAEAVRPEAEKALAGEVRREVLIMVAGVVRQIVKEGEQSEGQ